MQYPPTKAYCEPEELVPYTYGVTHPFFTSLGSIAAISDETRVLVWKECIDIFCQEAENDLCQDGKGGEPNPGHRTCSFERYFLTSASGDEVQQEESDNKQKGEQETSLRRKHFRGVSQNRTFAHFLLGQNIAPVRRRLWEPDWGIGGLIHFKFHKSWV